MSDKLQQQARDLLDQALDIAASITAKEYLSEALQWDGSRDEFTASEWARERVWEAKELFGNSAGFLVLELLHAAIDANLVELQGAAGGASANLSKYLHNVERTLKIAGYEEDCKEFASKAKQGEEVSFSLVVVDDKG